MFWFLAPFCHWLKHVCTGTIPKSSNGFCTSFQCILSILLLLCIALYCVLMSYFMYFMANKYIYIYIKMLLHFYRYVTHTIHLHVYSNGLSVILNHLRANFFTRNKNIYLHFMLFFHIDMTRLVEIFPQVGQELAYSTSSKSWVLMSWRRKEPWH